MPSPLRRSRYRWLMRWILLFVAVMFVAVVFLVNTTREQDLGAEVGSEVQVVGSPAGTPLPTLAVVPLLPAERAAEPENLGLAVGDDHEGGDHARLMIAASLRELFPGIELSTRDAERLAGATVWLRRAHSDLRRLPPGLGFARQRDALNEEISAAVDEIAEVMNLDPGDLQFSVQPGTGIDSFELIDAIAEGEFHESGE